MAPTTTENALQRALRRLRELGELAVYRARTIAGNVGGAVARPNVTRDPLTARERDAIAEFSNSELFSDRSRMVTMQAVDPATGRRGEIQVSVNSLHMIEPSYDEAKTAITRRIGELVAEGILAWDRLPVPIPVYPTVGDLGAVIGHGGGIIAIQPDTRLSTGLWADFPAYGGIAAPHLNTAGTALGVTPVSPRLLPFFPLPRRWRKLFPGPNFYRKDSRGQFTYTQSAMIADLEFFAIQSALLVKGGNASPEWHPAFMAFNNGTQFPSRAYPPDINSMAYDDVLPRYQYKEDRRFAVPTNGARGSATGVVLSGKMDTLWQTSARVRQRCLFAENHQMPTSNDWGKIVVADAAADYARWANLCSFLCDLGATAHVHAATEAFNAVSLKAMDELGLARGGNMDAGVARERAARGQRAEATRADLLEAYIASLVLAAERERTAAVSTAMDILNGGLVASAQLFAVNPYVGAVALGITAVASFIAWIAGGGMAERHQPELVYVKDGSIRTRAMDESDDPQGDVYGGNTYPWTRRDAVYGKPVIRVRDASGREYE